MTLLGMLSAARWYFVALALLAYAARLYRQVRRLRDFKGPFGTGFTNLWIVKAVISKRTHLKFANVCEKYGQS